MRTGIVIQARMTSRRLPGKVLRPLAGRPLLQWTLERAFRAARAECVIVATSVDRSDDPIARWCADAGVECVRGPLEHVAQRFAVAAQTHQLDAVVRLCADTPLIDPAVIDRAVELFLDTQADLATNVFPSRTFPPGMSVEVIGSASLAGAVARMERPEHREHVTRWFYDHAGRYRIESFSSGLHSDGISLAIDTPADLERLEAVVARLPGSARAAGLKDILAACRSQ